MATKFFGIHDTEEEDVKKFKAISQLLGMSHAQMFSELIRFYIETGKTNINNKLKDVFGD